MKLTCEGCGCEKSMDLICHGHKISYKNDKFICDDCDGDQLTDKQISDCLPKCCGKPMMPE